MKSRFSKTREKGEIGIPTKNDILGKKTTWIAKIFLLLEISIQLPVLKNLQVFFHDPAQDPKALLLEHQLPAKIS